MWFKIITGANEDVFSRLKKLNSKLLVFGLAGVLIIGVIIAIVIFLIILSQNSKVH